MKSLFKQNNNKMEKKPLCRNSCKIQ